MPVPNANIRSPSYFLAQVHARCAQCGRQARVLALAVPPGHEIQVDGEWQDVAGNAFIFHVAELADAVARHIVERSRTFRRRQGQDPADSHWVNHCEHCAEPFSDEELHCEPGGFMPSRVLEAEAILLAPIEEEFSASAAGYALAPEFFASMRRA
jgi:hypothetical protein